MGIILKIAKTKSGKTKLLLLSFLVLSIAITAISYINVLFKVKYPFCAITTKHTSIYTEIPKDLRPKKTIHLYPGYSLDPTIKINRIKLINLFFVPKGESEEIKQEWLSNLDFINKSVVKFYEKQFDYNITVNYQIISNPIKGVNYLSDYESWNIIQEVNDLTKEYEDPESYNIKIIFSTTGDKSNNFIQGGFGAFTDQSAVFWWAQKLDNYFVKCSHEDSLKDFGHEVGHILGIPHPWEFPINRTGDANFGKVKGDIMSYENGTADFDQLYIRDDVKKEMGL